MHIERSVDEASMLQGIAEDYAAFYLVYADEVEVRPDAASPGKYIATHPGKPRCVYFQTWVESKAKPVINFLILRGSAKC